MYYIYFHFHIFVNWQQNDGFGQTEGVNYEEIDAKDPETLTEEEKIALLGRPRLGDVTKIQIRIKESKEFKVFRKNVLKLSSFESLILGQSQIIVLFNK